MCGIVGYVGPKPAVPFLLDGLKRLEYRGYDSAGVALLGEQGLQVVKTVGKVSQLTQRVSRGRPEHIGFGHTRWATHGVPSEANAHPHLSMDGKIALVHNGIIENYAPLREELRQEGVVFRSETDTEVLVHLIARHYHGDLAEAVRITLGLVSGAYGICVMHQDEPDRIVVAKMGSPLLVGLGIDESFVASDQQALVGHSERFIILEDGEMAVVRASDISVFTVDKVPVEREAIELAEEVERIDKGGFPHFMLKEIFEQPRTIADAFAGRLLPEEGGVRLGGIAPVIDRLKACKRIILTACGTSWHAALVGEYILEDMLRIPVEVEYASEFRYRNPVIDEDCCVIAISQSGETADTLAAMKEAKRKGALVLGICNRVGSAIARESHAGVYLHAGPEIGVASTKAFTSQLVVLILLAVHMGRLRYLGYNHGRQVVDELRALPERVEEILKSAPQIKAIAEKLAEHNNALYLGRGLFFPVALEGALKLKEISYIHAEGYPAAEMKHGPIALIDENMPVIVIAPRDDNYEKVISNIQEVRARRGKVVVVATRADTKLAELADEIILIPEAQPVTLPILAAIPLQLIAYYVAVKRGCDVDQPRNLAKSVTVE
jgi:glucosamine--fructose-6-phosphate aminotransferase (isomerizing)